MVDARASNQRQDPVDFGLQYVDRAQHALLSARCGAVEGRASHEHHVGPQRERLDDIGSTPESAVHHDRHAPTDRREDVRQHIDRRWGAVKLPAAVVGDEYAIRAILQREQRVFRGEYALHQQLFRPEPAQPGEVLPVERVALLAKPGESRGNDAPAYFDVQIPEAGQSRSEGRPEEYSGEPARVQQAVEDIRGAEPQRNLEAVTAVEFAVARYRYVRRIHQDAVACTQRALHEPLGGLAVLGHVELKPGITACLLDHALHGHERCRGQRERHVRPPSRTREGDVGVMAIEAGSAGRRDSERAVERLAEYGDLLRPPRHVDQGAWREADALECPPVFGQGHFLLGAPFQKVVSDAREPLLRDPAQVFDVVGGLKIHDADSRAGSAPRLEHDTGLDTVL